MSEEMNDGTWSGLRKTIVGTLSTVVAGGGTIIGIIWGYVCAWTTR